MTTTELLIWIASDPGEVAKQGREMIGSGEIALLIAKAALTGTTISLSPSKVAETLGSSRQCAHNKIENTAIKNKVYSD
jgi:hypothetical protein